MKILLHTCCGPCAIVPLRRLRAEGAEPVGLFANANIHPFTEWKRRRETLEGWATSEGFRLMPAEPYDPREWLRSVAFREDERCRVCHHLRLRNAAQKARDGGFDGFSTTLLYSRFQKHDLIREVGEGVASEVGLAFVYRDWRDGWREGVEASKAMDMYRQPYCGCIYSEWERYRPRATEKT